MHHSIARFAASLGCVVSAAGLGLGCSASPHAASHLDGGGAPLDGSAPAPGSSGGGADASGVVVSPSDAGGCIGADAGVLALTSDGKPISFIVAGPNPATGDWMGQAGYVAQIFSTAAGAWQANLLSAFDAPNASPVAVLNGTPTSCTAITFSGGGWTASLENGKFSGSNGSASFDMQHVMRASPTLGASPPQGGVVLFDGTSFDEWQQKAGQNWLQPAGPSQWKLVEGTAGGAMEVVPGTDSIITKRVFGDCTIHMEFRTVGTPTHSGIFPEARYQTTVLQNYGLYTGNVTGNFGNESPVVNPTIHADRAPLEWQTLDIDFTAPRFTGASKTANATAKVTLNGVAIFGATPLNPPIGAAGRFPEAPTGPILLEYHGMPVQYRNIWVVPAGP